VQLQTPQQFYGHSFDEATGQYMLPVRVYPEADGSCPLPQNTVDFPPTEPLGSHQTWRINHARTEWDVVDDFRSVMLWDTASGCPAPNGLALGERPPVGVTTLAPLVVAPGERLSNRWNAQSRSWRLVPDYSHTPIWAKASGSVLPMLEAGMALPASAIDVPPPTGGVPVRFDDAQRLWVESKDADPLPLVDDGVN